MKFKYSKESCKYVIICPSKTRDTPCQPNICSTYKQAEQEISERELTRATIEKLFLEDMQDF